MKTVHETKNTYNCDSCGKDFGRKGLNRHIQTVHGNLKEFKCDICNKVFGRKSIMKQHKNTIHVPNL